MKKKFLSVLTVFLITIMLTSTVSAGGNVKLSGVRFALGSLIAEGFVKNTGNTDITVVLDATGIASITCTHLYSEDVPGKKNVKVSASGQQTLYGGSEASADSGSENNNKRAFYVETVDPETLPWDVAGCPSSEWTAQISFISWTKAKISVFNGIIGGGPGFTVTDSEEPENPVLTKQRYDCKTKPERGTVSCKPVKGDDDDDDHDK
jgi:hypothetical protein